MKMIEAVLKDSLSRIGTVKVRNALNPLLWLDGALILSTTAAAFLLQNHPVIWLLGSLLGASVLSTLTAFFMLLFKDPDRLQSEEYQLRQLEIREERWRKSENGPILLPDSEAIDDPLILDVKPVATKGKK